MAVELFIVVVFYFFRYGRKERIALACDMHAAAFFVVGLGAGALFGCLYGLFRILFGRFAAQVAAVLEVEKCADSCYCCDEI